ncbi:MarR family winged helix-turn-helix transcriptional regulator [Arachidicoccus sp.]|uniref:MarR family winged helix-turn-helix transcriptional regulator n=1 Tax=Arachidicoccus sp. TaxID=1872624 RepID=UPI003D2052D0
MKIDKDFKLAVALNSAIATLTRKLRKQAGKQPFSLTEQTTMALLYANKRMLPSELADAHHISAQAISQVLNRLYEQNCIVKTEDETDKRKVYISLNEEGKQKLTEMRAARSEWLGRAIEKELTEEEKAVLPAFITMLAKLSVVEIN